MGKLTEKIEADLKQAMLAGDKELVSILRGLKSSLQYARVEKGADGEELTDDETTKVLQKESKKRADAAELYFKGGDAGRADQESHEKKIIDEYLPEMLSEDEIAGLVDEAVAEIGAQQQNLGSIIGMVRKKSNGLADGGTIARLVKEKLAQ